MLLVTGASGYIGRRLVAAARQRGLEVVLGVRDPARTSGGARLRHYDLIDRVDPDAILEGVDAVIHLAAILHEDSLADAAQEDRNVSGTRRLLQAARRRGVGRFVFLSSHSAAEDSPTRYGRAKWRIEQLLSDRGEVAVRTGLVSGGAPRGLWGFLLRLTRRLPVLPVVCSQSRVYPVHIDDLCAGLLDLASAAEPPPRLVRLAALESIAFGDYVRMLARSRSGRRVRLLPVPSSLARAAGLVLGTGLRERVLGLIALPSMEAGALPQLAPPLRAIEPALDHEGRRTRLLLEGRTLGRYALGPHVPAGALRRYVRAVLAESDPRPLDLPRSVVVRPFLLRVLDGPGAARRGPLQRRLALATRIFEMTPEAAARFHAYRPTSRVLAWTALGGSVATEVLWLPLRLAVRATGRYLR